MTGGFFLAVEGPDGAGKSTLIAGLLAEMRRRGLEPVAVREPGGTPVAELVRQALLGESGHLEPQTELLLVAAARAHLVQAVIRPALERGAVVVSDRYTLSTRAYQGAGRGLSAETVRMANDLATGGVAPDLTLVLDIPPELGRQRRAEAGRPADRLEREDPDFHARVAAEYLAAADAGVRHLDGTPPPQAVLAAAWAELVAASPARFGGVGVATVSGGKA